MKSYRMTLPLLAGASALLLLNSCSTPQLVELDEGKSYPVMQEVANLYRAPNSSVFDKPSVVLRRGQRIKVVAVSAREAEVELPDGSVGFVDPSAFEDIEVSATGRTRAPSEPSESSRARGTMAEADTDVPEVRPAERKGLFSRFKREEPTVVDADVPDPAPQPDAPKKKSRLFGWGAREESKPETVIVSSEEAPVVEVRESSPAAPPAWVRESQAPPAPQSPGRPVVEAPATVPIDPPPVASKSKPVVTLPSPPTIPSVTSGPPAVSGSTVPSPPPSQPALPNIPSIPTPPSAPTIIPAPSVTIPPAPIRSGGLGDLELKPVE